MAASSEQQLPVHARDFLFFQVEVYRELQKVGRRSERQSKKKYPFLNKESKVYIYI